MTLWIDGIAFESARLIEQGSQYNTVEVIKPQSNTLIVDRFRASSNTIGFGVYVTGNDARRFIELLGGISDRRGDVIIRSDRQKVWNNLTEVMMSIRSFAPKEQGPFTYVCAISGEFKGSPRQAYGAYRVVSSQLENDFDIEGRTIIPIPPGSANASHTTAAREGQFAVVAHADWDGGGYVAHDASRGKVTFSIDSALFHDDVCEVYDGDERVTNTVFERQDDVLTIQNGFCALEIDFDLQEIRYFFDDTEEETFTIGAFTEFGLIYNENDYVAGRFDTGEVLELWRGMDPQISNVGVNNLTAEGGGSGATAGSTNYLALTSGVVIASQRHFDITAGVISATDDDLANVARFLITATAETIADRAKEVLKRRL